MAAKEAMTFEKAMERIEEIVKQLEQGDKPLDDALSLFEEGTGLVRFCSKQLENAEQKVVSLRKGEDGAPVEVDFGGSGT